MSETSIYGKYRESLERLKDDIISRIEEYAKEEKESGYGKVYEHLSARIKKDESMREKCRRKNLPENAQSALRDIRDSVGVRIVCDFIDDIYVNVERIKSFEGCRIIEEKDYVRSAKPNGYRSYHMIIELAEPFEDVEGNIPGKYLAEIQLRTIAMDTWAALEHELKYKTEIKNQHLIVSELRRCADELAACDVSMQTIRKLIRENEQQH